MCQPRLHLSQMTHNELYEFYTAELRLTEKNAEANRMGGRPPPNPPMVAVLAYCTRLHMALLLGIWDHPPVLPMFQVEALSDLPPPIILLYVPLIKFSSVHLTLSFRCCCRWTTAFHCQFHPSTRCERHQLNTFLSERSFCCYHLIDLNHRWRGDVTPNWFGGRHTRDPQNYVIICGLLTFMYVIAIKTD